MTVDEILRKAFALTHRRLHLVLLDQLWKALWVAITLALLLMAGLWFGSELQAIPWERLGQPVIDNRIIGAALRLFWRLHRAEAVAWLVIGSGTSAVAWLVLEAYFRHLIVAGIKPAPTRLAKTVGQARGRGFYARAAVFLASGLFKATILASTATTLVLISFRHLGAGIAGIATFLAVAFLVTVIDTLIRSDAVDLLGTDVIGIAGAIGALFLFEAMIAASLLIISIAGFLNVASLGEALIIFGVAIFAAIFWSVLHSYLLLVRFSAVGIMRHDVVDF